MSDIGFKAVLPEGWPRPRGYAQGVVTTGGRVLRVAGQTGVVPGAHHIAAEADFGRALGDLLNRIEEFDPRPVVQRNWTWPHSIERLVKLIEQARMRKQGVAA